MFKDDEPTGYNTSDEEFERQLEEAAMIQEAEKAEKAAQPKKAKFKRGRGRNAKKSKKTGKFPSDPDAEGYEVWPEVKTANPYFTFTFSYD